MNREGMVRLPSEFVEPLRRVARRESEQTGHVVEGQHVVRRAVRRELERLGELGS